MYTYIPSAFTALIKEFYCSGAIHIVSVSGQTVANEAGRIKNLFFP